MKSEATRASIILLYLSISPSPPTFHLPSPTHCDTSDVWALSEWVWWWRRLLPSIVGNVGISLHCCKYGVCMLQPPQDRVRWKFLSAKWRRNIWHGVVIYLFTIVCVGACVCGVTTMLECAHDLSLTGLGWLVLPSAGSRGTLQHEPW